ncbi:hypothetical protein FRB95_014004 [Tulasnella sp. JGI-2019a]|nr:hypothetical protein FRB95_014004 [Tulasnella sp. JGI-2019a]
MAQQEDSTPSIDPEVILKPDFEAWIDLLKNGLGDESLLQTFIWRLYTLRIFLRLWLSQMSLAPPEKNN